jgi:hypothetical protein
MKYIQCLRNIFFNAYLQICLNVACVLDIESVIVSSSSPAQNSPLTPASTSCNIISPCTTPRSALPTASGGNWVPQFVIPEDKFSVELRASLLGQERLESRLRRQLVRLIVDSAMSLCSRPVKKELDQIAGQVVAKYGSLLLDKIDQAVVGSDHDSLTVQLVARAENVRRTRTSTVIRRKLDTSSKENKEFHAIDGFGCVSWDPKLPDGETEDTQVNHKMALKSMHESGLWDEVEVKRLYSLSYYLQRREINQAMTVANLLVEWPFLLTENAFLSHAKDLLGFDVAGRVQKEMGRRALASSRTSVRFDHQRCARPCGSWTM